MRTLLLPLLLLAALPARGGGAADGLFFDRAIFFAVLEGLYEDGVSTEDVEVMLELDNFVSACPICEPAREALALYRVRPNTKKDLGRIREKGLDEATRTAIRSEDPGTRFPAVERLIGSWIGRRVAMLRLTADERRAYDLAFERMRKEGMSRISGGAPAKMKRCAICDGACGGASGAPR